MDFDLLKRLCETPGVPGKEDPIREVVKDALAPLVDSIEVDVMCNVVGIKRGNGARKVMLAAHMDEIGFMVRHIDDKGFVRLQPLGGFDARQLFAQRVLVHTRKGEVLRGVLAYSTKPAHMLTPEEMNKAPQIESFFVDLGMVAEQVKEKVSVGDMVTMDRTTESSGDTLFGKAMDDRVGVFVMIEALRLLKDKRTEVDIYAVATAQEEVGLRGATTAAYAIDPDIGIALDVTLANDYPGPSDTETVTKLGQGAAIKIMDGSLICHPKLVEHFREIAEREQIPHQMEILPRGGTDAGALQRSRAGTVSITISVPTRYVHTVNEMVHRKDIEAAATLVARYLEEAHTRDYRF
jgi:putative aminopeptidase FrvX